MPGMNIQSPLILNTKSTLQGYENHVFSPYSPDYNPIELAFSSIKAHVRQEGELGRQDIDQKEDDNYVYLHLYDAAFLITADHALGYYHHCGYI